MLRSTLADDRECSYKTKHPYEILNSMRASRYVNEWYQVPFAFLTCYISQYLVRQIVYVYFNNSVTYYGIFALLT